MIYSVNDNFLSVPKMSKTLLALSSLIFLIGSSTSLPSAVNLCPKIFNHVFENYTPKGNMTAGQYLAVPAQDWQDCVQKCCLSECNIVFILNSTCYHISCLSSESCFPVKWRNVSSHLRMILVKPVKEQQTWSDVLKEDPDFLNILTKEKESEQLQQKPSFFSDQQSENGNFVENLPNYKRLDLGRGDIYRELEEQFSNKDLNTKQRLNDVYGMETYSNDQYNVPVVNPIDDLQMAESRQQLRSGLSEKILRQNVNYDGGEDLGDSKAEVQQDPEKPKIIQLEVTVESKKIQLPQNEASLTAVVMPNERTTGDKYSYLWALTSKPTLDSDVDHGTMKDQTKEEVKLSNLSEGVYKFKVTVTGSNSYGEGFTNITVYHEQRNNALPQVIINPKEQTIKLPNKKAILDGSASTDDDKIVSWKWELVQGPIGYSPTLATSSIVELSDLAAPGNYTFKLTLTDSDDAENSTIATIMVEQELDYPPQSNAGVDVILYLPHNSVTLNGSLSTDDHEITAWEWTKDSSDESKAVDMQNTRTPFLELSHLEEGIYTFELKVTDAKNQSRSSKVHVFVKPPTNLPPTAKAGANVTINLPQTWSTLNATESTDDIKITNYFWKQISGPTNANIISENSSIANATGLTLGDYVFELLVIDQSSNNGTSRVKISIVQEKNAAPVAHGGGDLSITLPVNVVKLNGSMSSDDLAIVNYTWTRDAKSLAVGNIIGNTNHESVFMFTNIVAGHYLFKLTVSDEQGLTSSDDVNVNVHPDPLVMNLVEVITSTQATSLTQEDLGQLKQKLVLLLGDNVQLHVRDKKIDHKTGFVILVFYVETVRKDNGKTEIMKALQVEKILKEKFWRDYSILGSSISEIRSVICQNDCSGHGICEADTRACVCETFWMPDIFFYWGITEANCDWSILYVIVFIFIVFLIISGMCWFLTYTCRNRKKPVKATTSRPTRTKRPQKYALLHSQDDEIPAFNRNTALSDSDTDSDVLFENSRQKSNGARNGGPKGKHRLTKLGRRIKT